MSSPLSQRLRLRLDHHGDLLDKVRRTLFFSSGFGNVHVVGSGPLGNKAKQGQLHLWFYSNSLKVLDVRGFLQMSELNKWYLSEWQVRNGVQHSDDKIDHGWWGVLRPRSLKRRRHTHETWSFLLTIS